MTGARRFTRAALVGLCALLLAPGMARAAGGKTTVPDAMKRLKQALQNLQQTSGYRVQMSVEGGVSTSPDHRIGQLSVRQTYSADVAGTKLKLMHVPDMQSYRTFTKGVRFSNGTWRNVVADRSGKIMDRLFAWPEIALSRAVRQGREAEWVRDPEEAAGADGGGELVELGSDDEDNAEDDAEDDVEDGSGRERSATAEGGKKDGKERRGRTVALIRKGERQDVTPRVLRVDIPPKEALSHFLEVEKSGCFGGG